MTSSHWIRASLERCGSDASCTTSASPTFKHCFNDSCSSPGHQPADVQSGEEAGERVTTHKAQSIKQQATSNKQQSNKATKQQSNKATKQRTKQPISEPVCLASAARVLLAILLDDEMAKRCNRSSSTTMAMTASVTLKQPVSCSSLISGQQRGIISSRFENKHKICEGERVCVCACVSVCVCV